ncbi:Lrp/AsnC family transcriptional regulator [Microbacterium sp. LTA6]
MERLPLDEVDRQILSQLADDARTPLVALAARVHLSRNAVKQRIERMERQGTIAGYTVVRGKSAATGVSAIVMVYRADRMRGGGVISEIAQIPEVRRCDILSGDFDLLVTLEADSMDRIGEVWEFIAALPGVADTVTSVSLTRVVDRR